MKQGIQEKFKGISDTIYEYGCYFLDLLEWGSRIRGEEFDVEDVIKLYQQCKALDYIGTECYVSNAVEIVNLAAGKDVYHTVSKTYIVPDDIVTYIVCNKKPMYTHFTLCYKGEKWDSLPPDRASAKGYTADSYRILR